MEISLGVALAVALVLSAIALVIGTVGYVTSGEIGLHLKEVADNRLPSVLGLEMINEAQTALALCERGVEVWPEYPAGYLLLARARVAAGNLAAAASPNGMLTSYTYDPLNRLDLETVTKGAQTLASYDYHLLPDGNRDYVIETNETGIQTKIDWTYTGYGPLRAGAWGALDLAKIEGATVRLHWTDKPYEWHVNDGAEAFVVLDGLVDMHFREGGEEQVVQLKPGSVFIAEVGDERVGGDEAAQRGIVVARAHVDQAGLGIADVAGEGALVELAAGLGLDRAEGLIVVLLRFPSGLIRQQADRAEAIGQPGATYSWTYDPGGPNEWTSSQQSPTHAFAAPGSYTVTDTSICRPSLVTRTVSRCSTRRPLRTHTKILSPS